MAQDPSDRVHTVRRLYCRWRVNPAPVPTHPGPHWAAVDKYIDEIGASAEALSHDMQRSQQYAARLAVEQRGVCIHFLEID